MSSLVEDLAEQMLAPAEIERWRIVREYLVPIVILGGPETQEDRLQNEARRLQELIVQRTVAAASAGKLLVYGVPADDPLADLQLLKPDALERAAQEHVFNIDLEGRRLSRGGKVLMIDLDVQRAPPQEDSLGEVGVVVGGGSRRRNAQEDALLKNKIETVLATARKLWPDKQKRPKTTPIVNELIRRGKALGYRGDTLRKILDGKYEPAKRLGISLDW